MKRKNLQKAAVVSVRCAKLHCQENNVSLPPNAALDMKELDQLGEIDVIDMCSVASNSTLTAYFDQIVFRAKRRYHERCLVASTSAEEYY